MTSDAQMICWYICYALGLICFVSGIVYLLRKKYIREDHFIKATAFEFVAGWILYLPDELFNEIPDSLPVLKEIESIFTALLRTFTVYLGNDSSRVALEGHPVFSSFYATLINVVSIVLLLFVAGLIIKFLDGPFQQLRLSLRKKRYTYIFPVCNEKTLAIAKSINKERINLIFSCIDENIDQTEKQKINDIHGIYVNDSISVILKRIGKKAKGVEIFLFGNTEESNLSELDKICKGIEEKVSNQIRIYVELSDTPWDLYDSFLKNHNSSKNDKVIINFVRTEENFVYNNLLKNSIFENAKENKDGKKEIKMLIAGMNDRNLEMLKAVLHLGQMPGYRLTVMVLDEKAGREALKIKLPEIYDECDVEENAIYKLIYKENVDENLIDIVEKEYPDFTFAFINAGDDLKNVNIALQLNGMCTRLGRSDKYRIQVNVLDQDICREWNKDFTENIEFVGDLNMTYAHAFITMSDIEKGTVAIHEVRYPKGTDRYRSWISYCNDEYNRHSVYARTLSFKYKVKIIHDLYDPEDKLKGTDKEWDIYKITYTARIWKIYEHMRWNMYTRTMGYVLADERVLDKNGELNRKTRSVAKVHNDLIDYSKLSTEEQHKDTLELTPEVVKILRNI